jgi:preprotein translocase subunit SecG
MNPEDQRTSCPGFLDEYGVWNNGFECPPLTGQIHICCGSESRRYCCTLENLSKPSSSSNSQNHLEKNSYSSIDNSLFLSDTKTSSNILTLPIILTCILIIIIIFLLIFLILYFWYRYKNRHNKRNRQNNLTTKTNLLVDHFPFSPPHHQFFINENNSSYTNNTSSLLHQQTKDSLTTTTIAPSTTTSTSSTSGRIPSDIYFNDWKDFLIAGEQPMNIYPTMSSHSNELNNEHHTNYLYHGIRQPYDVIV